MFLYLPSWILHLLCFLKESSSKFPVFELFMPARSLLKFGPCAYLNSGLCIFSREGSSTKAALKSWISIFCYFLNKTLQSGYSWDLQIPFMKRKLWLLEKRNHVWANTHGSDATSGTKSRLLKWHFAQAWKQKRERERCNIGLAKKEETKSEMAPLFLYPSHSWSNAFYWKVGESFIYAQGSTKQRFYLCSVQC